MSANAHYRFIKTELSSWHQCVKVLSSNRESKICYVWEPNCILLPSNLNSINETERLTPHRTHKELALVEVFAASIGVFDFFAEHQGHFEEEEVSIATLADESLGIPNLEGLLEYQLSLRVNVPIETWSVEMRRGEATFTADLLYVQTCWWVRNEGRLNESYVWLTAE